MLCRKSSNILQGLCPRKSAGAHSPINMFVQRLSLEMACPTLFPRVGRMLDPEYAVDLLLAACWARLLQDLWFDGTDVHIYARCFFYDNLTNFCLQYRAARRSLGETNNIPCRRR